MKKSLDILAITDLHYIELARGVVSEGNRRGDLALDLFYKALRRLEQEGTPPDLILFLGDAIEDGSKTNAELDLVRLAGAMHRTGIPLLAVPGNHDRNGEMFARAFGCPAGLHRVKDFGFILFHDRYVGENVYERTPKDLARPGAIAAANPGLPLIAVQHHPFDPIITDPYPYHLRNNGAVMASYRDAGVMLSLSGHYHAGQALHPVGNTLYATMPSLVETPFRFQHLRLEGRSVASHDHELRLPRPGLTDVHCHTEFAYCATTVNAARNIALARALGLQTLVLVEHVFHLYFPADYAWSYRWQNEPEAVADLYRSEHRGRMRGYRAFAGGFAADDVRMGIEVDLLADGNILLDPRDADGWDVVLGAIHSIPELHKRRVSQGEAETLFMRDVDRLLEHPIHVLAHPLRYFRRNGLNPPEDLFDPLAEKLARANVAAEVNLHHNNPPPRFLQACRRHHTRIALGSDSHKLEEVADFTPHLRLLAESGIGPERIERLLQNLSGRGGPRPSSTEIRRFL